jgi:light-regulated signal transduction histidine kinase (bacteriophytochrome)
MKNYPHLQVDLSNCDKEPIHLIGRIQAHGYVLIFDPVSYQIEQVSANLEALCGWPLEKVLKARLTELLPVEISSLILLRLEEGMNEGPFTILFNAKTYAFFLSSKAGKAVLELEPLPEQAAGYLPKLQGVLLQAVTDLSGLDHLEAMASFTASRIGQLLDYDRVMIYQFDEDYHGKVIAEKVKEGVKSYYNHHFPASDIPLQAREMLQRTRIRQISDVKTEGINLLPYFHPVTGLPTDIGDSVLRNPSEIHLEYLKNMGVGASISIAIIVRSKLWGLVCCHHERAKFIDCYTRDTALLLTTYFSSALLAARERHDQALAQRYAIAEKALVKQMEENLNITEGLFSNQVTILDLTAATGAAILLNEKLTCLGQTPSEEQIKGIAAWASEQDLPNTWATREFYKHHPPAFAYKELASGVLLLEISKHQKQYILCFKPQILETITWAGNPEKSSHMDVAHKLHPRKSFEKWRQEIKGTSAPWTSLEEQKASSLGRSVRSILLRCQAKKLQETNALMEETLHELKAKNEQLEDFTRIASHNLLSPLNNISGLISLYKRKKDVATARLALDNIEIVNGNMRQTLQDLHQILALAKSSDLPKESVDIIELIEKEKQGLSSQLAQAGALVETQMEVERIIYPKIYLQSMVHNLLSNALKYRSPNRIPHIKIQTYEQGSRVVIKVSDNGQGIDLEKHGYKLFGLYKTFHQSTDSRGLGLYLVKKQAEAFKGEIRVDSQVDQGTSFTIILPKVA